MKGLFRLILALIIALGLDWWTKVWAEQTLELYQPVPIMGEVFRFTLGYNTGVAFGLFSNGGTWPLIVTGIVILGLLIWFIRALRLKHFPTIAAWPIGFLLGGAIANFADRLLDGQVTDFLDVGLGATRWPTFNLADSFIMVGLVLLLLITNFNDEDHLEEVDATADTAPLQ